MLKKFVYKRSIKALFAALLLFLTISMKVSAADDINIVYAASDHAKTGETVSVVISVSGDVSLTTLGLRLSYDSRKLDYGDGQWAENLQKSNSSMTLISDVAYNGGQVLNISMISDEGYQNNGTMLTLRFYVKEDYSENPFKLELREITDGSMQSVANVTNITYQNTWSGSASSGDETGSGENGSESSGDGAGSGENGTGSSESDAVPDGNGAGSSTSEVNCSGVTVDASKNDVAKINHTGTFQTGVDIFGARFLFWGGTIGLVGVICIIIRRKLSK